MKKLNEKKGFTLAELLIVVAIIAILVAVAIPVFTSQLRKSQHATDLANVRSAYAEAVVGYMDNVSQNWSSVTGKAQYSTVTSDGTHITVEHNDDSSLKGSIEYDASVFQ